MKDEKAMTTGSETGVGPGTAIEYNIDFIDVQYRPPKIQPHAESEVQSMKISVLLRRGLLLLIIRAYIWQRRSQEHPSSDARTLHCEYKVYERTFFAHVFGAAQVF